jgi:ABC-type Zn uptake system ZnuABC Zn-binding protein ZnuA
MRYRTVLALGIALMVVASGCAPPVAASRTLCATLRPLELLIRAIAGPSFEVRLIGQVTAAGSSEPRSDAAMLLEGSAMLFTSGTAMDSWASGALTSGVRATQLSTAIEDSSAEGSWLSFRNAADMAGLVRDTLGQLYPADRDDFNDRYAAFVSQCSGIDGTLKSSFWRADARAFLAADMLWGEAAKDYGLRIAVEPSLGQRLLSVPEEAEYVRARGIQEGTATVVLAAQGGSLPGIQELTVGLTVCTLEPLGSAADRDYVTWLERQLTLLHQSLGS